MTESGAGAAGPLAEGFALIAKAARAMREGGGRRFLIINSTPSFAATWLVGRIGKFKARHPETDVLIDADPIDEALESGAADALIRWGAGEFPGLAATLLFKEDVFPVCAPRLVAGDDPLRSPEDLARHTLLHLDWNPAHASWPTWSDWLKAAGALKVDARHGVFFNNMAMTLRAAAQGQGVALTSFAIAADELAAGRLVQPFKTSVPTPFGYYFLCRAHEAGRAAHQGLARVPDGGGGAVRGGAGLRPGKRARRGCAADSTRPRRLERGVSSGAACIGTRTGRKGRTNDGIGCGRKHRRNRRRRGGAPDRRLSGVARRAVLRIAAAIGDAARGRPAGWTARGFVRRARLGRSVSVEPRRGQRVHARRWARLSRRLRRLGALLHRDRAVHAVRAADRIRSERQARPARSRSDPRAGLVRSGGRRCGEGAETA